MNNPTVPSVIVELDGKSFTLVEDFNALAQFEGATGLDALNGKSFEDMNATQFRAYLWSLMLREQPDTTLDEVGQLLRGENYPRARAAITDLTVKMVEAAGLVSGPGEPSGGESDNNPLVGGGSGAEVATT